jgi:ATP-dependent Clp protease, protease subunit
VRINIKGPIISDGDQWIYDWFGIPAASPAKVSRKIDEAVRNQSKELTVVINSGGGSVFAASEIYTDLKSFKGTVNVEIVGIAASAASVLAMAGKNVSMSPTAQVMIHNAATGTWGDYRDMDHTSDFLQKVNQSIMNAYIAKTGKTADDLKAMMDAETWMTAQEAKEAGFIDAIMFENEINAVANIERPELVNGMLPKEVIDKMRNELANDRSRLVVNASTETGPINNTEGVKQPMNLEQLKNDHPELFNQVKNTGYEEGVTAERGRIQAIEDLALPGNEELINKAKFETGVSAEAVAMEIIKAEKQRGQNRLQNAIDDAAPLNNVEGAVAPEPKEASNQKADEEAEAIANAINKKRGAK